MTQKEFFLHLLDRVVQLNLEVERERALRRTAEQRLVTTSAPQIDPRLVHDMMGAMASDRKIEAIKAHRSLTGYGLKESKDAVEAVLSRVRTVAA